jgi:hypothetical protein
MGSIRFEGVRYFSYPKDHEPRHAHGRYAETRVIFDLLPDGNVRISNRVKAVSPGNASKADIRHILAVAAGSPLGEKSMTKHRDVTTDAEIDAALECAKAHDNDPLARTVKYVQNLNLLINWTE